MGRRQSPPPEELKARRLVVRPEAESDVGAAYAWYEAQEPGLGGQFLAEIEHCFERVVGRPELHAIVDNPVRRALLRRFPYGVFYVMENDRIVVLAVFHTARDPEQWSLRH